MKIIWTICISVGTLFGFEYHLKPQQLNSKTYCFFGKSQVIDKHNNGNMVNSCFVDIANHWIVIDSGPTFAYAKEAYTIMQKVKKQDVKYVFNTHTHDDHWLGNSFYATLGTTIVGSNAFKKDVDLNAVTRMQNRITKEAYRKTYMVLPSAYVTKQKSTYKVGRFPVSVFSVNDAHSEGDIIIYIPHLQTLFAGDIIFNGRLPSLRDGDINKWINALKFIDTIKAKVIVGGHGVETSNKATIFTMKYLTTLKREVLESINAGVEIDDALMQVSMDTYKNIPLYGSLHRQNVEVVYRALEWGDE